MHLPNHPDTLFEFVKALIECGYRWLFGSRTLVETLSGQPLSQAFTPPPCCPQFLRAKPSITAIKTQGSDTTKLRSDAALLKNISRQNLGKVSVPPIVTQIGRW